MYFLGENCLLELMQSTYQLSSLESRQCPEVASAASYQHTTKSTTDLTTSISWMYPSQKDTQKLYQSYQCLKKWPVHRVIPKLKEWPAYPVSSSPQKRLVVEFINSEPATMAKTVNFDLFIEQVRKEIYSCHVKNVLVSQSFLVHRTMLHHGGVLESMQHYPTYVCQGTSLALPQAHSLVFNP